ncbi:MAG: type IV pili twitching motility protein PilT, partial [Armatimonadetes bacterium CG_4_10_14_0_8_um_filter_66_14]
MLELERLLRKAVEVQASDVFLKVDSPPAFRLHGQVHRLEHPPLTPEDMKEVAAALMTENQMVSFEQKH